MFYNKSYVNLVRLISTIFSFSLLSGRIPSQKDEKGNVSKTIF